MKTYNNKDVYTAAKERIEYIFDEFEHICISFSGGKDSGTVLNMCIDEARKRKRAADNEIPQGYYSLGYFLFIFLC